MTVAIDFPNSPPPSDGDTFTPSNGITYTFNNGKWKGNVATGSSGPTNEITNTDDYNTYGISVGTNGVVTMTTSRGGLEFGALPEPGGPSHFHIMRTPGQDGSGGMDLFFGDDFNYVRQRPAAYGQDPAYGVEIGANDFLGDQQVWRFGTTGTLTLPGGLTFPGNYYIGGGEGSLAISSPEDPISIIANAGINSKLWQFGADGSITFPDDTAQTTAYRNRPLTNLNLSGGTASTVFEIDMTYVDCGGSVLRGILAQDQYDGYDNGSTTTSFDKVLDGGQA